MELYPFNALLARIEIHRRVGSLTRRAHGIPQRAHCADAAILAHTRHLLVSNYLWHGWCALKLQPSPLWYHDASEIPDRGHAHARQIQK